MASVDRTRDVSLDTDSCGTDSRTVLPGGGVITGVGLGVGLAEVRIAEPVLISTRSAPASALRVAVSATSAEPFFGGTC